VPYCNSALARSTPQTIPIVHSALTIALKILVWAVQICSIHFGESTPFGALQRLWRVFPVQAGQKLQGRKLVGIDNIKNKLEKI